MRRFRKMRNKLRGVNNELRTQRSMRKISAVETARVTLVMSGSSSYKRLNWPQSTIGFEMLMFKPRSRRDWYKVRR